MKVHHLIYLLFLPLMIWSTALSADAETGLDFPGFAEAISDSGFVQFAACPVKEMGFWDDKGYSIWCGRTSVPGANEFKQTWEKFTDGSTAIEYEQGSKWVLINNGPIRNHFWFGEIPGFVLFNPANRQILLGLYRGVMDCEGAGPPGSIPIADVHLVVPGKNREDPSTITPPKRIQYVHPLYPQYASNTWMGGVVLLQVVIDKDGTPNQLCVVKADPDLRDFRAAAAEAVRQWRYKPATKGGEPVAVFHTVRVQFSHGRPRPGDQFRRHRAWP